MRFKHTEQSIDEYTAESDILRRKAESKMVIPLRNFDTNCIGKQAPISILGSAFRQRIR